MQNKKNNKKRNPVAKELYTPKYKSKVIPNKKKDFSDDEAWKQDDYNLLIKDVDDNLFGQSDEQIVSEIKKKGSIK